MVTLPVEITHGHSEDELCSRCLRWAREPNSSNCMNEARPSADLLWTRMPDEVECFGFFHLVACFRRPSKEPFKILLFMIIIFNLLPVSFKDQILQKLLWTPQLFSVFNVSYPQGKKKNLELWEPRFLYHYALLKAHVFLPFQINQPQQHKYSLKEL